MNPFLRGVVAGLFFCAGVATDAYMNRNTELQARRSGYAAAVDSVRAAAWRTEPIRILDAYGASYVILTFNAAGRETSRVHVGGAK